MKPTLACGHTEYDHGHCGYEPCENDYRRCQQCNPAAFPKSPVRVADDLFESAFGKGKRPGGTRGNHR